MAANAATRAGAKGVATAAGQAVANTGAKAVANTGAKAGTGAVANTAARTSGRGALPSTKEWVDAWNGSIGSRGGWNAIMPTATKNMEVQRLKPLNPQDFYSRPDRRWRHIQLRQSNYGNRVLKSWRHIAHKQGSRCHNGLANNGQAS